MVDSMFTELMYQIEKASEFGEMPWDIEASINFVYECARRHSLQARMEAARRYVSKRALGLHEVSPARWVLAAIVFAGIASRYAPSGDKLLDGRQGETTVLKAMLVDGLSGGGVTAIDEASRSSLGASASFGMSVLRVLRNFLGVRLSSSDDLLERTREALAVRKLALRIYSPTPLRALYRGYLNFPTAEPGEVAAWFGFWARVCGKDGLGLEDVLLASESSFTLLLDRAREISREMHIPRQPIRLYLREAEEPGLIAFAQCGEDRDSHLEVGVDLIGGDLLQLRVRWSFPRYGEYPVPDGFAQRLVVSLTEHAAEFSE